MPLLIGCCDGELLLLPQNGLQIRGWHGASYLEQTESEEIDFVREVISSGPEMMPKHISMIMDGNRRFAWNRSLQTEAGHSAGKQKLKEVMRWVLDLEIPYLTVYALSTEKPLSRDDSELETLFDLYVSGLEEISRTP